MKCPNPKCRRTIPDTVRYCVYCGAAVTGATPPPPHAAPPSAPPGQKKKRAGRGTRRRRSAGLAGVISVTLVGAALVGLLVFWSVSFQSSNTPPPPAAPSPAPAAPATVAKPQAPAPPTPALSSPANGAAGVTTTPTLSWNASSGAADYSVQLATDPGFANIIRRGSDLTGTSGTVTEPLAYGTRYWWRVCASDDGRTSSWSPGWSFTTQAAGPPAPGLPAPTLSSPADGASEVSTAPTLFWNASSGAASYQVQVSGNPGFTDTVVNQSGLDETSLVVTNLVGGCQYWWRVNARNSRGEGPWSPTWSFTTVAGRPPRAPTLFLPRDGGTGVSTSPICNWGLSPEATSYRLQVARDYSFRRMVEDVAGIFGSSIILPGLMPNTRYWWRVKAFNQAGESDWSSPSDFTTEAQ